jgi:anthranilate phosphoribosyltransferase
LGQVLKPKAGDLGEGVRVAAESIDSGRAGKVLEKLAAFTGKDS